MSQIEQFYAGQTIFITGGTGFLGKVLIEKLLRSCPDIGTVYLLIRDKKGKSLQSRVDALLIDPVFEVLRSEYPDFSKKVVGLNGDISVERLGLSTADYDRLISEVSSIFHVAATVRFNEKLDKAVAINVNSVKYVVDIAKTCKNLKVEAQAAVYVSTAYSNCVRKFINEELSPPPLSYEAVTRIVEDARKQRLSDDEMTKLTEKLLGEWPNTYCFTKAIAEGVVAEFADQIPFAVFRPSIVVPAYREPMPGWVNGPMGIAGVLCAIGLGLNRVSLLDGDARCDLVPVDYVCNALISCAWEIAITERSNPKEIAVYNYVSGNESPITWKRFTELCVTFGHVVPPIATVYYMTLTRTKSLYLFYVLEFWLNMIPALMVDQVASLFGKQPGLYKVSRKIREATLALGYFSTQQWDFENSRVKNLWKRMGREDKLAFPFSMGNVDWDEYCLKMVKGLRKFVLGDSDDTLERAKRRDFYLHVIHTTVRLAFLTLFLWIIWQCFGGRMFETVLKRS